MQSDLGIIAIVLICFSSIVITIKLLINGRIWSKLIENNFLRDNLQLPDLSALEFDKFSWLKWGIVIISFSLSLILLSVIPNNISDELKIGITGIFVGIAFIISYFISDKLAQK